MSFFGGVVGQKMRTPAAAVNCKAKCANTMVAEGLFSFAEGSFNIVFLVYLVYVVTMLRMTLLIPPTESKASL